MMTQLYSIVTVLVVAVVMMCCQTTNAWIQQQSPHQHQQYPSSLLFVSQQRQQQQGYKYQPTNAVVVVLQRQQQRGTAATTTRIDATKQNEPTTTTPSLQQPYDYEIPEDAVIHIKPAAMRRLRELRDQRNRENATTKNNVSGGGGDSSSSSSSSTNDTTKEEEEYLILRMGVRSGGCSGMSYSMDFCSSDSIDMNDDQIDIYQDDHIKCIVDSKSMLYLYGLQLDYSTELIGGGFKFYNPNAEESCGCGSSFGV